MADRYWVGGTGTWDASTTTNWATTSGGAGGASAPTSADNAYFDGNSDAGAPFTVTIGSGAVCADVIIGDGSTVTVLDQTMTLAGSATWTIYGSLYFPATNLTRTFAGPVVFAATTTGHTITTNGVTLTGGTNISTSFNGIGGEWTLGSDLTTSATGSGASQNLAIAAGSFRTNNYSLTTGGIVASNNANAKNIELGSSAITLVNSGLFVLNLGSTLTSTNTTLDAGTSTIAFTNVNVLIVAGGATFYNVEYLSASLIQTSFRGNITFNNLTFANRSAAGVSSVFLNPTSVAVNGTLSVQSGNTDPTKRFFFQAADDSFSSASVSPVVGSPRTLTAAVVDFGAGADFRDITAAGASAPWDVSGVYGGDCKNNTGITFPAPKTVYRIGTGNWSATQWAASSGGSPAAADFPLAQDTCVFDANTTTGTHTLDAAYNIGSLDMSALTVAVTLVFTGSPTFYGNVTLDADVTMSGTGLITFAGQGVTQTITSAGRVFTSGLTVNSPTGTVTLADALTTNLDFTLTQGALVLSNQTASVRSFLSNNNNTRSVNFGSGKIIATGTGITVWSCNDLTNMTFSGSPLLELNNVGSGTRAVNNGSTGESSKALSLSVTAGSGNVSASGSFNNIDFTGFSGSMTSSNRTVYGNLIISSGMSLAAGGNTTTFASSSGTQQITSAGKTFDFLIAIDANGASVQLLDNLTVGASRSVTLTAGTLDLNDKTLSTGTFSSSNSNTRSIDFGTGGKLECVGSGTVFNATTGTNLTTTGTGVINLTSASTKTFAGGGATYPTLNQGGTGTLLITGANTFADITNTVQPTTITFPSGVTTSVQDFSVGGTLGNLVTLNASTPGTRAILNRV